MTEVCLSTILFDLKQKGFALTQNLFSDQILSDLVGDIQSSKLAFKKSGIGRDAKVQDSIRGDYISWLDPNKLLPHQKTVFVELERIKNIFNEKFFLNLKDFECHLTYYPQNTSYEKHIDTFRTKTIQNGFPEKEGVRKVSFVIYLNKDWSAEDGGELVLYTKQDKEMLRVLPESGKSIFFLSDEFPHEVLTNQKERLSLTGWMF